MRKRKKMSPLIAGALSVCGIMVTASQAYASEAYVGEIKLVGFNFCPRGTIEAAGQLMAPNDNATLFSLFGTIYGGNGRTTFALPDLRGRAPIGQGQGPLLSPKRMGQQGGRESYQLQVGQLPSHSHQLEASSTSANNVNPSNAVLGNTGRSQIYSTAGATPDVAMSPMAISTTGGNQPIDNMSPYLTMRYCVVVDGIYPPRS